MREAGRDLWAWLAEGAHVYVCGDAKRMAKDVERALVDIVAHYGARDTDEAIAFVAGAEEGRPLSAGCLLRTTMLDEAPAPRSRGSRRTRVQPGAWRDAATKTTCPYCGVGCGVLATPDGAGGAEIAGDPGHPANFGRLCSKGSALDETLALNGRLLHPMLRDADGRLQRVSWDDALDDSRAQIRARSSSAYGPDAVARLSFRPIADRGLLRRQQIDEGIYRLVQCRHQFAPVHGLDSRRPAPRLWLRHRAGLLRGSRQRRI